MTMEEFLFYKRGRRNRSQMMHDLLVVAKDGLKKSRIMHEANLSGNPFKIIFKVAVDAGLIEEVEDTKIRWNQKPSLVWKTTKNGIEYAKNIYDSEKAANARVEQ